MAETTKGTTATDVILRVMENFSEAEPEVAIVIYNGKKGLVIESNAAPSSLVGTLEIAKACIVQRVIEEADET